MAIFALYRAPGHWQDAVIRAATGSPYSHVELLRGPVVDGVATCISASKRDGNHVRVKPIRFKAKHWDFIEVQSLDPATTWARAHAHLGAPYDVLGAVLSVTPWPRSSANRWFCSQLLGHAAGLKYPHILTPGMLATRLVAMGGR
jgi:hypothetical protein